MTRTVVQILGHANGADRTDGQLLDLFVQKRDQEAFAAVVRRHGPMVLGVCRRVLRNHADADDAFQAAFLVLARKAASVGRRERLAQWLHGVAFNTARRLRRTNTRRGNRERPMNEVAEPPAAGGSDVRDELVAILDEELARLPERYRLPIVLCDLQGTTRKEAARQLGCPEGTVAGRLARARAMLAERLTARGVVPMAALLAVLAERAGAVSPALIAEVLRTVGGGVIPARVAETTEGVLKAMFAKKLRAVAAAVFLCGFVLACAAGLVHIATASADPPAPFATAAPEKPAPDAKPGDKVLSVIPLKQLNAEETAKQLRELYRGHPVTAVALPDDKAIMLYATEPVTKEIDALLVKLGEAPRKRGAVIPVPGSDAKDVAGKLQRLLPATGGPTIVAANGESALLVHGTDAQVKEIQDAVQAISGVKPAQPGKGAPEPKKYTINFRNTPWAEVLDWYAKETGLTLTSTVKPTGTVTITPPKDRLFTLAEVTDLINETLIQQKFILIRRTVTFILHPADEKIDASMIPRIELGELANRGRTELVQVVLPLKGLAAEDTAAEVQKMLTPFGAVAPIKKLNALIVTDTAGNIKRIWDTIQQVEAGDERDTLVHVCKFKKAQEVADQLKKLLPDSNTRPGGGKHILIAVDEKKNAVTVTGPEDKIALAKNLIEEIDKPKNPGDKPLTLPEPELRKYPVPPGTADAVAKALVAADPNLKVVPLPDSHEIMALATAEGHQALAKKLKGLNDGAEKKDPEKPAAKKFTMRFKNQPWDKVLGWFADISGLTPIYTVAPSGTFTFEPPNRDQEYTLGEIVDILNEAMAQQKFMLIRRKTSFIIHPTDEKPDGMIQRYELSELADRGKTELVQVLIPLKNLKADDVVSEVQKLLTPFGQVSILAKTNTLVVLDTAGNLRRIAKTIEEVDRGDRVENVFHVHQCKSQRAADVIDRVKTLVDDSSLRMVEERASNSVILLGGSSKSVELAKKLLPEVDKPKNPGG